MNLFLVRRGNEQWYCPREQVELWASQGCAVYELTPTLVAGQEQQETSEYAPNLVAAGSTEGGVGQGDIPKEA